MNTLEHLQTARTLIDEVIATLSAPPTPEPVPLPLPGPTPTSPIPAAALLTMAQTTYRIDLTGATSDARLGPCRLRLWRELIGQTEYWTLTIINDAPDVVGISKRIEAESYAIEIPYPAMDYAIGGENGQVYQGTTFPASLYQGGETRYEGGWLKGSTYKYDGAGGGQRWPGWVVVGASGLGLGVALKDAWQQFPNGCVVSATSLRLNLYPQRAVTEPHDPTNSHPANPRFYLEPGQAKTYRLLLAKSTSVDAFKPIAEGFQDNLQLQQPLTVLGLARADGTTKGYDDDLIANKWKAAEQAGFLDSYGWRNWGAHARITNLGNTFYADCHVGSKQYLDQGIRTNDLRWVKYAFRATQQWIDFTVCHAVRKQHPYGLNDVAGEPLMTSHELVDHRGRNLHDGHAQLSALVDYVALTQDPWAIEVLKELGGWFKMFLPRKFPAAPAGGWSDATPHVAEAERDYGWPLYCANELYRGTGDLAFHKLAVQGVQHLFDWMRWDSPHLKGGVEVGRNRMSQGTGWWCMWPRQDNTGDKFCTGTNPWMAGGLLSAIITTRDNDLAGPKMLDAEVVRTMLLQAMEYITKWGYLPASKQYVYSEGTGTPNGLHLHLLDPLAWCAREIQRGVPNAAWYTTAGIWKELAVSFYKDAARPKGYNPDQFFMYGYSTIFMLRFWQIAKEIAA